MLLFTTGTGQLEYYPDFTDSGFNFDNLPSWGRGRWFCCSDHSLGGTHTRRNVG